MIDLPSEETRDKLLPLISAENSPENEVVMVEGKLPTITIENVSDFVDRSTFLAKVKNQNSEVGEKIESGSTFNIIYSREISDVNNGNACHQVVAAC